MRAIVTAAAVAALVGSGVSPVHAASTDLLVSTDGVNFSATTGAGLFDGLGVMVPEDTFVTSVWVQNPTATLAEMRVSVREFIASSSALSENVTLTAFDSMSGTSSARLLSEVRACDVLVPSRTIPGGAIIRIDISLYFHDVIGTTAQSALGRMDLLAAMRDGDAGPFPASACDDEGVVLPSARPGVIAYTGYETPTLWLVLSGLLIGFGLLFATRKRRREREDS